MDPQKAAFLAAKKAHTERFHERFNVLVDRGRGLVFAFSNNPYAPLPPDYRESELAEVRRVFEFNGFTVAAVGRYPADGPDRGYTYAVAVEAAPEEAGLVLSLFEDARKNNLQNKLQNKLQNNWGGALIHSLTIDDPIAVLPPSCHAALKVLTPCRYRDPSITEGLLQQACRRVEFHDEEAPPDAKHPPLDPVFARAVAEVGYAALAYALNQLPEPVGAVAESAGLVELTVLPTSVLILSYMLARADGSAIPVSELDRHRAGRRPE